MKIFLYFWLQLSNTCTLIWGELTEFFFKFFLFFGCAESSLLLRLFSSRSVHVEKVLISSHCGMWNLPRPGIKPMSPELAGTFLITGSPQKSGKLFFNVDFITSSLLNSLNLSNSTSVDSLGVSCCTYIATAKKREKRRIFLLFK